MPRLRQRWKRCDAGPLTTFQNRAHPEQISHVLSDVNRTRELERRVADLESRLVASSPEIDLATQSPEMRKALDTALKAAQSEAARVARDMRQFFTSLPAPSEEGGRDFCPSSR